MNYDPEKLACLLAHREIVLDTDLRASEGGERLTITQAKLVAGKLSSMLKNRLFGRTPAGLDEAKVIYGIVGQSLARLEKESGATNNSRKRLNAQNHFLELLRSREGGAEVQNALMDLASFENKAREVLGRGLESIYVAGHKPSPREIDGGINLLETTIARKFLGEEAGGFSIADEYATYKQVITDFSGD